MITTLLLAASLLPQFTGDFSPRVACNTGGTTAHVWIHTDEFDVSHLMVKIAGTTSEVSLGTNLSGPNTPDIDIDDDGNYVIAWKAHSSDDGQTHSYLTYNSLSGGTGVDPDQGPHRVTISRTGGKITLAWTAGGDYLFEAHCRNGGTILARRFEVSGGGLNPLDSSNIVVASAMYYSNYELGNVSSGSNGDPVFVYLRTNMFGTGCYAKGLNFSSGTTNFGELTVSSFSSGGIYYSYCDVDCSNDGGFFVTYSSPNGNPNGIVYRQYDSSGSALTTATQVADGSHITTQAWNAVAVRKNTNSGTTCGAVISWTDGTTIYWVLVGSMPGTGGSIAFPMPYYPNVHSGAADGSGNFLFDYLEDPTAISVGAFASFP